MEKIVPKIIRNYRTIARAYFSFSDMLCLIYICSYIKILARFDAVKSKLTSANIDSIQSRKNIVCSAVREIKNVLFMFHETNVFSFRLGTWRKINVSIDH